jgi:hypothetical protein
MKKKKTKKKPRPAPPPKKKNQKKTQTNGVIKHMKKYEKIIEKHCIFNIIPVF